MATTTTTSSVVSLHPKRPLTGAERQAAYRARKAAAKSTNYRAPQQNAAVTPVTASPKAVTPRSVTSVTQASVTRWLIVATSIGLAGIGMAVNGTFARGLGSSAETGWLFLGLGVAADAIALLMPSAAGEAWAARKRGAAVIGWGLYAFAFLFVVNAGIGFASLNVTDVTLSRAGRVTPQVEAARHALNDAMESRNRECAGGVGKNCRAREEAVAAARKTHETAMATVAQAADPQTESAARIVAWISGGVLAPKGDDFAMMRLILLALLPQLGGLLLMVGRASR